MRAKLDLLGLVLLIVTPHAATPLRAQDSTLLRYQPRRGAVVRSVSWTDMNVKMSLGGLMDTLAGVTRAPRAGQRDSAGPVFPQELIDSLEIHASARHYLTEQVLDLQPGRFTVWRTVDSTRARVRAQGEDWAPAPHDRVPRTSARVILNDRYQIAEFALEQPDGVSAVVRDFLRTPQGMELGLPGEPVAAGASWITEVVYPFSHPEMLRGDQDAALVQQAELVTRATVTVDSIVERGPDTLTFMRVSGTFLPVTVTAAPERADRATTLSGGMAGTLIWSAGWNAFVSGSSRAVLTAEVRWTAPGAEANRPLGVRFDITNRFQVRP